MIVERVALRDFRRFERFEARLGPGLNVVLGGNESGKSTLREAIALALYENPRTTKRDVLAQQRWGTGERFAVELEFTVGGARHRLTKDFQRRTARLEDLARGETLHDLGAIGGRIQEYLGLASRSLFESTVWISQREITRLEAAGGIADSLSRVVGGAADDVQASEVLADLERAAAALRSRSRGGPLALLPEQIAAKRRELAAERARIAGAAAAAERLAAVEAELRAAEGQVADEERLTASCERRLRLEAELARETAVERELETRAEQVAATAAELARAEGELAALGPAPEPGGEALALERLLGSAPVAAPTTPPPSSRLGWVLIGAALVAAGLLGSLAQPPLLALALLGALVVVWGLLRPAAALDVAAGRRDRALADRADGPSADELADRRRAAAARGLADRSRARLAGLLADQSAEQLDEARRAASRRARDLREQLAEPDLRLAALEPLAYQRLQRDLAAGRERLAALRRQADELRGAAAAQQLGLAEAHALEEESAELERRLAAAQWREQVYRLAHATLAEARAATLVGAREVLEAELGGLVGEITGGRYDRVRVDATSLGISLVSPECERPVEVELGGGLSTGTVEQVYLAARLALAELLAPGRQPPLILDDPFVTFDGPRTRAALGLLRRIAAERQVILLTCQEDYREFADRLLTLPPPGGASP